MDSEPIEVTTQPVYLVYEYFDRGDDMLKMVIEDDGEAVAQLIEYCTRLSESDSPILAGDFHAASPGEEFLQRGDWYLKKTHGVDISHSLER